MLPDWWWLPPGYSRHDEDDECRGPVPTYACLRCDWEGKNPWPHHQEAHHPIAMVHGPRQIFPCCERQP